MSRPSTARHPPTLTARHPACYRTQHPTAPYQQLLLATCQALSHNESPLPNCGSHRSTPDRKIIPPSRNDPALYQFLALSKILDSIRCGLLDWLTASPNSIQLPDLCSKCELWHDSALGVVCRCGDFPPPSEPPYFFPLSLRHPACPHPLISTLFSIPSPS